MTNLFLLKFRYFVFLMMNMFLFYGYGGNCNAATLCAYAVGLDVKITASGTVNAPVLNYNEGNLTGCYDENNNLYSDSTVRDVYEYFKINVPFTENDGGYLLDVRHGVQLQIYPYSWMNKKLIANSWVYAGYGATTLRWWALDADPIMAGAKLIIHPDSVLGGDIYIDLNDIFDMYAAYVTNSSPESWSLGLKPTLNGRISGVVVAPKGQCVANPASVNFDLGDYSKGPVVPKLERVSFACDNPISAELYINNSKVSSLPDRTTVLDTNGKNKVSLGFSKSSIVIDMANGSDYVDVSAKLIPAVEKDYGEFYASAYLDLRIN